MPDCLFIRHSAVDGEPEAGPAPTACRNDRGTALPRG